MSWARWPASGLDYATLTKCFRLGRIVQNRTTVSLMRRWIVAVAAFAIVASTAGLYWFQPWKLFTSTTVNDAVPVIQTTTTSPAAPDAPSPPTATLVAHGALMTHEHTTSGTAELVRLPNGRHQLILRGLSTSDGPDLRVWLTDQPVLTGRDGWHVFDDGMYLELGRLKGNRGTQVYDVPADSDVTTFRSVTIWCKRFAVSFGAAELVRV